MPLISKKFQTLPAVTQATIEEGQFNEDLPIYIDGAGTNGEISRLCVAQSNGFNRVVTFFSEYTNNSMEYQSLLEAIEILKVHKHTQFEVRIYSDSQLLVNQLTKGWKTNSASLLLLQQQVIEQINLLPFLINLEWIPREKNIAGKILERKR